MLYKFARSVRFLTKSLIAESTPQQIAIGFAIGVMIGLVPKDNLICVALIAFLFLVRVNIAAGLFAAAVVSGLAPLIEPFLHEIGLVVLTIPAFQTTFSELYRLPLVPWTHFNNSVVAGGLLVGLLQLVPTVLVVRPFVRRNLSRWSSSANRTRLGQILFGEEIATRWRVG